MTEQGELCGKGGREEGEIGGSDTQRTNASAKDEEHVMTAETREGPRVGRATSPMEAWPPSNEKFCDVS
jgi:hypothetical protein